MLLVASIARMYLILICAYIDMATGLVVGRCTVGSVSSGDCGGIVLGWVRVTCSDVSSSII